MEHAFTKQHVAAAKSIQNTGCVKDHTHVAHLFSICLNTGLCLRTHTPRTNKRRAIEFRAVSLARMLDRPGMPAWADSEWHASAAIAVASAVAKLSNIKE